MNAYELADRHVTQILHVLNQMGARGIRVDREKLSQFNLECERQMATLQEGFDSNPKLEPVRGWHPKAGYKKTPPTKPCPDCDGEGFIAPDGYHPEPCNPCGSRGKVVADGLVKVPFYDPKIDGKALEPLDGCPVICDGMVMRWARRKPFLASSSQQVLSYIRSQGHQVSQAKNKDTGESKDTSGQKALLLAWRKYKDPLYKEFVDFRRLKKLRGTYGEWSISADNRVRTRFTLRPDTGRLSSIQPNVQNIPKDGPLAGLFRDCLVASPGHRLVRADLASVEALLTGWFASDQAYMRLSRLGLHKYAMAKYLGLEVSPEMTDEQLQLTLSGVKDKDPLLYRKIKTTVYGSNYLAGPRKIFEANPEEFESQADAKKFQQFVKSLSTKVGDWQRNTIRQATATHKLTNPFGYIKEFWDLPGGDGPAAVAFLPQSTTAAIMKEVMLQLWEMEAGKFMVWQIHDELVFDVPEERVPAVQEEVERVMTQSWPQLGGLSIGCEVKISESMV